MAVKKTYRINLRNYGSPPAVMVSQYDEGYAIAFEIFDGPLPVLASSLSGYTFKLKGRQPGNPPFLAYEFEGTLATALNAVVSFEIDTTMTGRAGKGTAELVILDEENDVKFASVNFAVYTEPAAVPDGSIDADVQRAMEIAEEVQDIVDKAAAEVKGEAEAWAVGQRNGEDVPSTDPTYHNNAKYYSEVAQDIADSIGIDATLSISGKAADAKKTGDEISALKEDLNDIEGRVEALEQGSGGSGLTAEAKNAILACFRGVAWRGDVNAAALYSALDTALNPPANLSSISAVYTQSGTVDLYDSLESLRSDLVVTAHYTDNTSAVVTSYTLSGQLTLGTSTITVSYGGKTTTFTVTVTSEWDYVWDLTKSLTDTVGGVTAVASAGTGVDAPAITSSGLVFNAATQRLSLGDIDLTGKTIELDVASFDFKGSTSSHIRFIMWGSNTGPMIYRTSQGWTAYALPTGTSNTPGWSSGGYGANATQKKDMTILNGNTVKLVFGADSWDLYIDGAPYGSITDRRVGTGTFDLSIGGTSGYTQSSGDQCYDMTISAIRIKTNPTGGDS